MRCVGRAFCSPSVRRASARAAASSAGGNKRNLSEEAIADTDSWYLFGWGFACSSRACSFFYIRSVFVFTIRAGTACTACMCPLHHFPKDSRRTYLCVRDASHTPCVACESSLGFGRLPPRVWQYFPRPGGWVGKLCARACARM